jgi:hypothetical protein
MKKTVSYSFCFLVFLVGSCKAYAADAVFPELKGNWFGQEEPGLIPEIFAPGLISVEGRYEFCVSFSPNLKEMYFTVLDVIDGKQGKPAIFYSKVKNQKWTRPQKANFTRGVMSYELLPHVSLNGDRIYFSAGVEVGSKNSGVWYVMRNEDNWSEAKKLDLPLSLGRVSDFNQGPHGGIFLTKMSEKKMYYSEGKNDDISDIKALDIEFGVHGFIAPKEDYLLVNARTTADGRKDHDLFVMFKEKDNVWSKPINLGASVNSHYSETVARVTPDGKFLFFGRYDEPGKLSNIYWVSTKLITQLKESYFNGK